MNVGSKDSGNEKQFLLGKYITSYSSDESTKTDDDLSLMEEDGKTEGNVESKTSTASKLNDEDDDATYKKLLVNFPCFRIYILSYLVAHVGEWFTLVASISVLQKVYPDSQTAMSGLFLLRLLPNILFSSIGGVLADSMDRRHIMITLDLIGMCTVWLYFLPIIEDSNILRTEKSPFLLMLLYFAIFVQATISALYEPARKSIAPMMVPEGNYLKKATTLAGIVWSCMTAVGSLLGGITVSKFGLSTCFTIDSFTYLLSAILMWYVDGEWDASSSGKDQNVTKISFKSLIKLYFSMTKDVYFYLRDSQYLAFVLLKASGCLIFGAADILNIDFSHRIDNENKDSVRLGVLYSCVGVACLIGPLVADQLTDMNRPRSLQLSCVFSFVLITLGFFGWGVWGVKSFHAVILFTFVRSIGSAVMWIDSTLLIQKFTSTEMLGRVTSIDYMLATISCSLSTFLSGYLQDRFNFDEKGISYLTAILGVFVTIYWCSYHFFYCPMRTTKNDH